MTPLSELSHEMPSPVPMIIVIDALDECERPDHLSQILTLLSRLQSLNAVHLRTILTSRSAPSIISAFDDLRKRQVPYQHLALDKELSDETRADISTFLRTSFATIKNDVGVTEDPWPEPEDLVRLVALATNPSPLFIYAATLCRFVGEDDWEGPVGRLRLWLEQCDSNAPQLNQIYEPILREAFSGRSQRGNKGSPLDDKRQRQVIQMLGTIILLATPLPATALAVFLNLPKDTTNRYLRNLHAVLNVPADSDGPVRVLHKSFSDFLLGQEGMDATEFRVEAKEIHLMLLSQCIQRMSSGNGLRKNICEIGEPGKLISEIDRTTVSRHISPDLEYACLYWTYHLQQGGRVTNEDEIYTFVRTHFLHWLESLSLLRRLSDGIQSIRDLLAIIPVCAFERGLVSCIVEC